MPLVEPHPLGQAVPGHAHEQANELRGLVQVEIADGRPEEEADHDRLADVHRVEHPAQPRVAEPEQGADLQPDLRLVAPDQLLRGTLVTLADPADEVGVFLSLQRLVHRFLPDERAIIAGIADRRRIPPSRPDPGRGRGTFFSDACPAGTTSDHVLADRDRRRGKRQAASRSVRRS